jgi:hypothetical protein
MSYDLPVRRSQQVGSAFTVATLPTASQMVGEPTGMLAYTTDGGLYGWNGTAWAAVGGGGGGSGISVGVTSITGGTSGYVMYDNAGVVGELNTTGSGNVVLATSPTLVTPNLGTPTTLTLTSATGLPLTTGVTGTLPVTNGGTGVTTSTGSGSTVLSTGPTLTGPVTVTEAVGSTALTLTGATQTTAVPVLNATQTWNNVSTTFTGIKLNVTDTTSAAASLLMDLQVGGASKFNINKDGSFTLLTDTILTRDAADTLAQRRTTNAQAFRVYNTYTDASNYERVALKWVSNIAILAIENAGTGSNRAITIQAKSEVTLETLTAGLTFKTSSINRWYITASGPFLAALDNTYDIGNSGALRPRIGYFGTRVDAPTLRTDTAYTVATLPAAGTAGRRAYVTDALAPTFLGAMTGGGAVICPVFDNGTAWVAG